MSTLRRVAIAVANYLEGHFAAFFGHDNDLASAAKRTDFAAEPGKATRLLVNGLPNPDKYGLPLRVSHGNPPLPESIQAAAQRLGRPASYLDSNGYEREILGAAISPDSGAVGYVEARAKEVGDNVDITIRIHLRRADGNQQCVDIESYNPFFGCDVCFFKWIGESAVLVYQEKHCTYACSFGDRWPPRFVKIENDLLLKDSVLTFIGYQQDVVQRLSVPSLALLEPISVEQARQAGVLPGHATGRLPP